ncbi:ABC transporter substrate-binding protein [Desertihabitans aurantiacus]|uniref:ABC transporter substrate-binding protein n=1 Tax=Desertihabitans aurantiacus TaxID=2282477 RepID=UPI000DF77235|nr:ABC transporter substrate-binding protein [Desertihabitans aurantiacus]
MRCSPKTGAGAVAAISLLLASTACQAGDLTSTTGDAETTITFLSGSEPTDVALTEGVVEAFEAANPDVAIQIETRPGGSEGDNLIKTRLATEDMPELFEYNSGSLFQALNPTQSLTPMSDQPWVAELTENFAPTVTAEGQVYGAPWGAGSGGGVMYNAAVYEELGLEIPRTWDQFMANNEEIKAAGKTAVVQAYGTTWTSQLFVLADYHNVEAESPGWAEQYTANQVKYADPPALDGFTHIEEVREAGYINEDAGSTTLDEALAMIATGEGVHFPILSWTLESLAQNNPDAVDDIGFFALPGEDEANYGLTEWQPGGLYIPATATGPELEAAQRFVAFVASQDGCTAMSESAFPGGAYGMRNCTVPDSVPRGIKDVVAYSEEGNSTPALEFVSPVKGPALEQICIEVGTGTRSAADAAALYDEDVKKQAEQLGLPGW